MDITFFAIDWERLFEVLALIVVLSFLVERALAVLFESRLWVNKLKNKGFKEPIAFAVSLVVCFHWHIDALGLILKDADVHWLGYILTAGVIAGGSKASVQLFQQLLNVKSSVVREAEAEAEALKKTGLAAGTPAPPTGGS